MSEFDLFLQKQLEDPDVKAEYDALEPEFAIKRAMIQARAAADLTQSDLAKKTGIAQSDISRLENGVANPSLKTLKRLAEGLGLRLKISFEPADSFRPAAN